MIVNYGFDKSYRLLKKAEFQKVFDKGFKIQSQSFIVICIKTDNIKPRIGIVASKKIGNATQRNRAKRLLREVFRQNKHKICNVDIIFILRKNSYTIMYQELEKEFNLMLSKIKDYLQLIDVNS